MNIRRVACAVGLALAVVASTQAAAAADQTLATYYVSLGDSLAAGYQPGQGDTSQGYADQLFTTLTAGGQNPTLQPMKLGCSGETTTTMLNGNATLTDPSCNNYKKAEGNSQVKAAVQFLAAHPGQVKYLTIDIGANDVQTCAKGGTLDPVCAVDGIATLAQNLPDILAQLKAAAAASNNAPAFVGMNYYNPFLAAYLTGTSGKFLAAVTSLAEFVVTTIEENEYRAAGGQVADVSGAFHSYDFFTQKQLPTPIGTVPLNVYNICTLTYECTPFKDIHTNQAGYAVIAKAFGDSLGVATPSAP